jgi:hypothetical protein
MEKDDRRNGPILTKVESTQIFGNVEEIYHLHLSIAEQLDRAIQDDECIGSVFLSNVMKQWIAIVTHILTLTLFLQAVELLRVYQPYTKFYDKTIEAIHTLEKTNSRFYAYLKVIVVDGLILSRFVFRFVNIKLNWANNISPI